MLIFHKFAERDHAVLFVATVFSRLHLDGSIYNTAAEAIEADPFPGALVPPVVHIERPHEDDKDVELTVIALAGEFGGVFAGT